jgi:hypothetical protein
MAKTFSKFGLKRSLNLGDIPDRKAALNNILDNLRGARESFTWEDIELLRDISLTEITTGTFTSASNATVKSITSNGTLQIYEPLITLENRFDKAYFTTSEPFFAGGDGLTAKYYDSNAVQRQTPEDPASNFTGFDDTLIAKEDDFWERGNFVYGNKIIVELLSLYGGVEWEGYFKPSEDGLHRLRITSGGFVKIEFDDFTESREFTFDAGTGTFNYNNYDFTRMAVLADQTKLDQSTDLETAVVDGTSNTIGEPRTITVDLGSLSKWEAYKIKISYFIDEAALAPGTEVSKSIDVNIVSPSNQTFTDLNYKRLYTKDYFQNYDIGDFRAFIEDSISRGGTEIGLQGTIGDVEGTFVVPGQPTGPGDSYSNVTNFNPIISYHEFPSSTSLIELDVDGCDVIQDRTNIRISNSRPNSTEDIEVGNFIFGDGIPDGCRVTKVIINNSVEVYPVPIGTFNNATLTFVNHRGLVAFGDGDVAQDGITNITNAINLADIKSDQVLLSFGLSSTFDDEREGTTGNALTGRLVEEYDGSQIVFKNITSSTAIGNQRFYVYQSFGLNNDGLDTFCVGVYAKRIRAGDGNNAANFTYTNTGANSVVVKLDDVNDLTTGMYAHLFPTINYGSRADGSVDELFSEVTITNISGNDVTLTHGGGGSVLIADLNYLPDVITRITFSPTDINKEVCFRPTDTSPPFSASPIGLTTNFDVAMVDDFTSNGGGNLNPGGKVTYSALEINHNLGDIASNVLTYSNQKISNYLPIEDDAGNTFYMILGD